MTEISISEEKFKEAMQIAFKEGNKNGLLIAIECIKEIKRKQVNDIEFILRVLDKVYKEGVNND